jgi:type II secretory pathway pseudopilin PulG
MTLVEVTVSMALLGLLLAIVFSVLVSFQNAFVRTSARSDALDQAHLAVEQLDSQIRSGNVLYDPATEAGYTAGFSLRIFTQTGGTWNCSQWKVASNVLYNRTWLPTYPGDGSSPSSWRTVATDIANTSAEPPFSRDSGFSNRLIDIDLYVSAVGQTSSNAEVRTSVEGRDTEYGYPTSACSTIPPG